MRTATSAVLIWTLFHQRTNRRFSAGWVSELVEEPIGICEQQSEVRAVRDTRDVPELMRIPEQGAQMFNNIMFQNPDRDACHVRARLANEVAT